LIAANITLQAQTSVFIKVLTQEEAQPVTGARVFFAGTVSGGITNNNGLAHLKNIQAGSYQLVISSMGYKLYKQTLTVPSSLHDTLKITLEAQPIKTGEVTVIANRPPDYRIRVREFTNILLGASVNGQQAIIRNPDVLDFTVVADANGSTYYEVSAREPLVIVNKRLGYYVTFVLEKGGLAGAKAWYQGPIYFDEMTSSDSTVYRRWETNRKNAARGTLQHFIATLIKATSETIPNYRGFQARRIVDEGSYLKNWVIAGNPFSLDSIPILQDSVGTGYKILFPPCFEIIHAESYTEETYQKSFRNTAFDDKAANRGNWHPRSLIVPQKLVVHADKRGFLYSPDDLLMYGYWGWLRLADEVPVEYYSQEP
jgi:hypothetical protein